MGKVKKFTLKAKLHSYSIDEKGFLRLVLYLGNKKKPEIFVLSAFFDSVKVNVLEMIEKRSIVKFEVKFGVRTSVYNGRYYTNLILLDAKEWISKAKKLQIASERFSEEQEYRKIDFKGSGEFE